MCYYSMECSQPTSWIPLPAALVPLPFLVYLVRNELGLVCGKQDRQRASELEF